MGPAIGKNAIHAVDADMIRITFPTPMPTFSFTMLASQVVRSTPRIKHTLHMDMRRLLTSRTHTPDTLLSVDCTY